MLPFALHSVRRAWIALFLASVASRAVADVRTDAGVSWAGLRTSFSERFEGGGEGNRSVVGLAPELRWAALDSPTSTKTWSAGSCDGGCIASDSLRNGLGAAMARDGAKWRGKGETVFDATLGTEWSGDDRSAPTCSGRLVLNPR